MLLMYKNAAQSQGSVLQCSVLAAIAATMRITMSYRRSFPKVFVIFLMLILTLMSTTRLNHRHILQDWDVWLSKQDNKGNDVNLHLENIYLDELQEDGLLLYERIKVLLSTRFLAFSMRAGR